MKTLKEIEDKNIKVGINSFESGYGNALKDILELIDEELNCDFRNASIERLKLRISGNHDVPVLVGEQDE